VLRQLLEPVERLEVRARELALRLAKVAGAADGVTALPDRAFVGGGSLPGFELDTWVVALRLEMGAERFAELLRRAPVPVLARVREDLVLFDVRTLLEGDETVLERVVGGILGSRAR